MGPVGTLTTKAEPELKIDDALQRIDFTVRVNEGQLSAGRIF
jgi:hypothetical protein